MEAPLPASALIHSATLVSAGIFLTIKYNVFFKNEIINFYFQYVTIIISVFFALISVFQTDIKKILAYSTIANCSFIYHLIFSKNIKTALIYFSIHGIFKSMVFIIFGFSIIFYKHKQDYRYYNNIFDFKNKITFLFIIPVACLCSLQITPVYYYKSFFNLNYYSSSLQYVICFFLYILYSCFSFLYYLNITNNLFFKKNRIKTKKYNFCINEKKQKLFFISFVLLYLFMSYIFLYIIIYKSVCYPFTTNHYLYFTYVILFSLYLRNTKNIDLLILFNIYVHVFIIFVSI